MFPILEPARQGIGRDGIHFATIDYLFALLVFGWVPALVAAASPVPQGFGWQHALGIAVSVPALLGLAFIGFRRRFWQPANPARKAHADGWPLERCQECGGVPAQWDNGPRALHPPVDARAPSMAAEVSELRSQVAMLNLLLEFTRGVTGLYPPEMQRSISEYLHSGTVGASALWRLLGRQSAEDAIRAVGVGLMPGDVQAIREDFQAIGQTLRSLHTRWLGQNLDETRIARDLDLIAGRTRLYGAAERLLFHSTVLVADVAELTGILADGCARLKQADGDTTDAAGFPSPWNDAVDLEDVNDLTQLLPPLDPTRLN